MIGMLSLLAFAIGIVYFDEITGRTMCFMTLSIAQLFHAFNMRTENSIFSINPFDNRWLVGAFFTGVLLQVGVATVPIFASVFRVKALSPEQWGIVFALSCMPIIIVEAQKWWTAGPTTRRILSRAG